MAQASADVDLDDDTKSETASSDFEIEDIPMDDADFQDLGMDGDSDSDYEDAFAVDMGDLRRKSSSDVFEIHKHLRGHKLTEKEEIFFLSDSRLSTLHTQSSLSSLFEESVSSVDTMDSPSVEDRPIDPTKMHRIPSANYLAEVMSGSVVFSRTAFIREWMYNFWHPFCLPIVFLLEGESGARSRAYWGNNYGWPSLIYGYLTNLSFWVLQYLYWFQVGNGIFVMEYSLFCFLYLSRVSAIAVKWGYQPEEVFDYMREKPLTSVQISMLHLLQGWANVQPMAIAREILQSAGRLKVDISKFRIVFRDDDFLKKKGDKKEIGRIKEVLCRCKVSEPTSGDLLIPYLLFMTSRSMAGQFKMKRKFVVLTALILSVLPTVGRIQAGKFGPMTAAEKAYNIINVFWTLYLFFLQLMFINVVALDFRRRDLLQVFCTRLIQPGRDAFRGELAKSYKAHLWPKNGEVFESLNLQSIDLTNARSVFYWAQLRRFFMDFGLRWLRREEGLLSLYGSLILIFELGVLFGVFVIGYTKLTIYDFIVAFAAIFVIGMPVMKSLSLAQRINYSRDKQRAILSEKRLNLHNEAVIGFGEDEAKDDHFIPPDSEEAKQLTRAVLMIDKIMEMMKHGRYTITFLGFRIDVTVTSLVASVLGSIGFTLARVLTQGQSLV